MKYQKLILAAVLAAVLVFSGTGCGNGGSDQKTETEEQEKKENEQAESTEEKTEETIEETDAVLHKAVFYLPDENAEGWDVKEIEMEQITADALIGQLVGEGVLMDSILVQEFEELEDEEGYKLNLDLSATFLETLQSMGTAGEILTLGSVVNSFLDTYGADSIMITVDGNVLETGHEVYDYYISHMEI